ncbi:MULTISPECIES: TetR/AcrR family transcriptional regulator [unclassified Pseudonocardia]|uniref:TetR/AcrR family transcriptional regulator n=1 Tax=unclassified Pseudonocardia TaxID=2619320 RepID=UPI001CF6161C|nr:MULTISPECIES: TetR/AcrR family transcriptional regulator [unclassified Pseudonocardia]
MAAPQSQPGPRRRMRAAERRDQLARTAAARFHLVGYHQVSLGDVAADVGLTGPAVYRHFPNKQALLAAGIAAGLDEVAAALDRHLDSPLEELVTALTRVALDRPDLWTLLQREVRFLSPQAREEIRERLRGRLELLSRRLRRERPELTERAAGVLVTGALGVLATPSVTHIGLDDERVRTVLAAAALACLRSDPPAGPAAGPDGPVASEDGPSSRPREIVDRAVALFHERGYVGVSLDEIGAAVGMAGPSLLHHFASKADILTAAFDLGSERLRAEQAARRARPGSVDLPGLIDRYVGFCLANRALLGVYVSEFNHLTDDARRRTADAIRTELRDWTRSLLAYFLDLDEPTARLRVRAALSLISDLTRLTSTRDRPAERAEVTAAALAVLRSGA